MVIVSVALAFAVLLVMEWSVARLLPSYSSLRATFPPFLDLSVFSSAMWLRGVDFSFLLLPLEMEPGDL